MRDTLLLSSFRGCRFLLVFCSLAWLVCESRGQFVTVGMTQGQLIGYDYTFGYGLDPNSPYYYGTYISSSTPITTGTILLGTLPGGANYDFNWKTREQILEDFTVLDQCPVQLGDYGLESGQFIAGPLATAGIPPGTQLFVFFSSGADAYSGSWCVLRGTDNGWYSNASDENLIELSAPDCVVCATERIDLNMTFGFVWRLEPNWQGAQNLVRTQVLIMGPYNFYGGSFQGQVGVPFSQRVYAELATSYSGSVPEGLTISSSGLITGAPLKAGTNTWLLSAANEYGSTFGYFTFAISRGTASPQIGDLRASSITYGQRLRDSVLASSETTGFFTWGTNSSVRPPAGCAGHDVTFTPKDTTNYSSAVVGVQVCVEKATPRPDFSHVQLAPIAYGQSIGDCALPVSVAAVWQEANDTIWGTVRWAQPSLKPEAGTSLSNAIIFTADDTNNFTETTIIADVVVNKALPSEVTKPQASELTFGQRLDQSELTGGLATVPGVFAWFSPEDLPAAGTTSRTVLFTPADRNNYESFTTDVSVTVKKASNAISFGALPRKSQSDAPFKVRATATSGLPVSFASSDTTIASIEGDLVTITGTGEVKITCFQNGDGNWSPATPAEQVLVVSDGVSQAAGRTSFAIVRENLTWSEASADAQIRKGALAALPTEELHNKVVGALRQDFSGDFWIGLAKAADGIGWEWVDGSFLIYENWASGQPLDGKHAYVSGGNSALWRGADDSETRGAYAMQSTSPGLAEADLVLTTGEWASDSLVNRDGYMSARASALDNSSTYREYMIAGPALLDFYWKVSSEKDFDYFTFSINGSVRDSISGEVDWAYRSIELGPGSHRIRWEYSKDESAGIGADAAWLDEVVVYPAVADLEVKDGPVVLQNNAVIDFGSGGISPLSRTLILSNKGYISLNVGLRLPEDSAFSFEGGALTRTLVLGREESSDVRILMDTTDPGAKRTALSVNAPGSVTSPPALNLEGSVLSGRIVVRSHDGPVTAGQSAPLELGYTPSTKALSISNQANSGNNLRIAAVNATGNFSVSPWSGSLAPGEVKQLALTALDSQPGLQSGVVTIMCNDSESPSFEFPVRAKSLFGIGNEVNESTTSTGTGGAASWDFGSTTLPAGGVGQALKTGATPDNGASILQGVFQGPGLLTWKWKVGAQQGFDWLTCEVNGVEVAGISTKNPAWQTQAVRVPAGASTRWIFRKDASGSVGEDAGYLADVSFQKFGGPSQAYDQWAANRGSIAPNAKDLRSGLPYVFAWLGGWDPASGPGSDLYRVSREGELSKYRFPVSKTASGSAEVQFITNFEFQGQVNQWTSRGLQRSVYFEDSEKAIIEVTAPSQTRGFFRLIYQP
jgi:hypothetical protein